MPEYTVVFDSPTKWDAVFIYRYLQKNIPVFVVEPFFSYHHPSLLLVPPPWPSFVEGLVRNGKISALKVEKIKAREIPFLADDKAVEVVEAVYPQYRKEHETLFQYVSDTLKSSVAENVFKKNLCGRLARFYSVNIMLHRIEKVLAPAPVLVYPDTNVQSYLYLKELLSRSEQKFFKHPNIRFPAQRHIPAFFENLKKYLITMARLSAQTVASGFLGSVSPVQPQKKKSYSYGVIISSQRQLFNNQRGPDIIIDNNKILPEDVVYFSIVNLTAGEKEILAKVPGEVFYLPKSSQFFSHFAEWKKLLWIACKKNFLQNSYEINTACKVFFSYFRWLKVLEKINIRHLITHCDFGVAHIGRNIALNQAGVQTWYFTDSMGQGCDCKRDDSIREPYWTYLYYDHFVTWDELLAQFYKGHPETFRQLHVVGCLWSGHIQEKTQARTLTSKAFLKDLQDRFVLAVFDSGYLRAGFHQGLAFARDILKLADDCPEVYILFKVKKDPPKLILYDPNLGSKLADFYNKMNDHPRITVYSEQSDATELMSISDMVVSFTYTSTTFEALSVNKPAIWHDPMGYRKDTLYGKIGGVTTHSYDELKAKVLEIKNMKPGTYQNPIPMGSPLMDPYRDGKAIERFRDLLVSS